MPAGIQIFNEQGDVVFDVSDRAGKILGFETVSSGTGWQFTDERLLEGTPFVVVPSYSSFAMYLYPLVQPRWTASGDTITFSPSPQGTPINFFYGIF